MAHLPRNRACAKNCKLERALVYDKFAKFFHDGGGDNTIFHPQFCEILEREDIVNGFFALAYCLNEKETVTVTSIVTLRFFGCQY